MIIYSKTALTLIAASAIGLVASQAALTSSLDNAKVITIGGETTENFNQTFTDDNGVSVTLNFQFTASETPNTSGEPIFGIQAVTGSGRLGIESKNGNDTGAEAGASFEENEVFTLTVSYVSSTGVPEGETLQNVNFGFTNIDTYRAGPANGSVTYDWNSSARTATQSQTTADGATGSIAGLSDDQTFDLLTGDYTGTLSISAQTGSNLSGIRIGTDGFDLALNTAPPVNYRIYILGGQSNGNGRGDASQLTSPLNAAQSDVQFYWHRTQAVSNVGHLTEDTWIDLDTGSGHGVTTPVYAREFGPEVSFGRAMADNDPAVNIAIIKYCHGGSNLHTDWSATGERYTTFLSTVQTALAALTLAGDTYELGGMIWVQGENDTYTEADAGNYQTNLTNLINRVRQDLFGGASAPFVLSGLSDSQFGSDITTVGTGSYTVRQAQETVAANMPQVGFVNTDGFQVRTGDEIHFEYSGQIALGQGLARGMLALEAAPILIDYTFDGVANDMGPVVQVIDNGIAAGTSNTTTGSITTGADNHTLGFNSSATVDLSSYAGFTATFVVDSLTLTSNVSGLLYNGLFFGVVTGTNSTSTTGTSLWNNDPKAFGYVPGSSSWGSHIVAENTGSVNITSTNLATVQPTNASLVDGFTINLNVFPNDTWQITSTGLSTELNQSGTLPNLTYTDFAHSGLYISLQGESGAQIDMARMTLTGISDIDEDGMPDAWEDANGLNKNDPDDADHDNDNNGGADGLTNLQEYQNQTDPQDSDSDNDGLNDGDEVNGTLNPWTNGVKGSPPGDPTSPLCSDSDDDTVNDGTEISLGTDPNALPPNSGYTSPFVDTDGDSYRDDAETALGSNPNDADDCPNYTPNPAKPNIVIIYADDLGFGDISRYGNLFGTSSASVTPNVDRLADQGVTFTQAHSANAVCTPSRYSLLTGIYNWRNFNGISLHYGYKNGISNIPLDSDVTIADFLKTQGYDTAAFGKWHLGGKWYAPGTNNQITGNPTNPAAVDWTRRIEGHATDFGFDYFRGLPAALNIGPYVYLEGDIVQYWVEDSGALNEYGNKLPNGRKGYFRPATSSDTFTWLTTGDLNSTVVGATDSRACLGDPSYRQIDAGPILVADFERYIDERATSNDTDPFFAYVALHSPHKPWAITPEFNNSTYGNFVYARWIAEVDDRIGRIISAIDNQGMTDNTIIILTSDNGPETTAMTATLDNGADANGPLRGAKRDIWEGGTRVPFIVRWPGQAPAGMVVTDELISQVDIFPTLAAYLGADLPATTASDGESFLNVLRGQRKPGEDRSGVVLCSFNGHLALKSPDGWKLIDSTGGGGNRTSWDADNNTISSAIGTNQGTPKQLFELPVDLGEDDNLISSQTSDSAIRAELVNLTGRDLLGILDQLRAIGSASLFGREPDNDADGMSNSFENTHGLNRDSPKDAALDRDGDGADNLSESIAGTDPNDRSSVFRVINLTDVPAVFAITWPSVTGRDYEVCWSTDLINWTSYSNHAGSNEDITAPLDKTAIDAVDGVAGNLTRIFVKVRIIP